MDDFEIFWRSTNVDRNPGGPDITLLCSLVYYFLKHKGRLKSIDT